MKPDKKTLILPLLLIAVGSGWLLTKVDHSRARPTAFGEITLSGIDDPLEQSARHLVFRQRR